MIELTPEQQIRDMIARTGLTPQEFATAYSNLTPEQIRAARSTPTTQDWNRAASELAPAAPHPDTERLEFVIRLLQEFGSDGLAKRIWDKYGEWDRAAIDAARAEKGN